MTDACFGMSVRTFPDAERAGVGAFPDAERAGLSECPLGGAAIYHAITSPRDEPELLCTCVLEGVS